MESSSYQPLRPSSEGPNPLRPYYRPPSIGIPSNDPNTTKPGSTNNFGSSARDILSDLNYGEILGDDGASGGLSFKGLLDQLVWRYSSVLMAQPFEVAKTILQVKAGPTLKEMRRAESKSRSQRRRVRSYSTDDMEHHSDAAHTPNFSNVSPSPSNSDEDEDDDHPSYFTSSSPSHTSQYASHRRQQHHHHQNHYHSRNTSTNSINSSGPAHRLHLYSPSSLLEVLSQLWLREGAWGVWKASNVTFLYGLLLKTVETWTRSMFSAILNLPDAAGIGAAGTSGGLDIVDSPAPFLSLLVAVSAAGVAGVLLAPLDIVRTRLLLTPTSHPPRSTLPTLRLLPSYLCPSTLLPPTLLHSTLPTLLSTSTPLLLRTHLRIDPVITPASYSAASFLSSALELFVKLPVETVLRRAQMAEVVAAARHARRVGRARRRSDDDDDEGEEEETAGLKTTVPLGPYKGVVPTLWHIAREEGESAETLEVRSAAGGAAGAGKKQTVTRARRGQGVAGLWRGWRVGWWGLVGVWGAAAMGAGGGRGGEF